MQIRNGYYARYKGRDYKTKDVYKGENISIYSEDISDLKLGFEEYQTGKYRKVLRKSELETVYKVTTYARYRGHRFVLMAAHSDEVTLTQVGWQDPPILVVVHLGFNEVERAVFEKTVPIAALDKIWVDIQPVDGFPAPVESIINQGRFE